MGHELLYIDLFCGAGGTSTGVETARRNGERCAKVIACVNHDANAIASHAANHPEALHFTEDIRTLELSPLVAHTAAMRRAYPDAFVVLWASAWISSVSCGTTRRSGAGRNGMHASSRRAVANAPTATAASDTAGRWRNRADGPYS